MGVRIGTQMHANYSNQTLKCFTMHLSWEWQPIKFPEF